MELLGAVRSGSGVRVCSLSGDHVRILLSLPVELDVGQSPSLSLGFFICK